LPHGKKGRALVIDSAYGVLGYALRLLNPELAVHCHYDDAWHAERAKQTLAAHPDPLLSVSLEAEPPEGPYELLVLPLERQGVTELVRERLRLAASKWLAKGGLLYSSSDWAGESFVREEIRRAFGALTIKVEPAAHHHAQPAVGYVARRPVKVRVQAPRTETRFYIQERRSPLGFDSRAGVFCSDRLDAGSRALLALADTTGAARILDLGCGCGVVGIVAALREPDAQVVLVDSNARAIEAARQNIEAHGVAERAKLLLSADPVAALAQERRFDLVLTNPPYYGNWRIAELFLETAQRVLRPSGLLQLVTKSPQWYLPRLETHFRSVREEKRGGYTVISAKRK
jgi:16S rRNA (guanine1207-N2)-methyltransferase